MARQTDHFQVFLSFRGPDTRQGFTNCLYHCLSDEGIRVFKDDVNLLPGEQIAVILDAVRNSQICIPIFSRGYSSSKWCLRELAEMVKFKKEIIPVFYDVDPGDVKLETNLYGDGMRKFASAGATDLWCIPREKKQELKQWEDALRRVGKIVGLELKDTGYADLCKTLTKLISDRLKIKRRIVTANLIGIEGRLKDALKFLDTETEDVRCLVIHGMSGIGKTTLAKVVFNNLYSDFEHCSFLSDIKERANRRGIVYMQNVLLNDLVRKSRQVIDIDDGITTIISTLRERKVLIVLDDVDKPKQISNLVGMSPQGGLVVGSRIIVTTEDKRVLTLQQGIEEKTVLKYLEMGELETDEALQLFCRYAFGTDYPPSEFLDLSKEVVSFTGNLPLSLEIIGAQLYPKENKEEWEATVMRLRTIPLEDIQEKLMLSYKPLASRTKEIFLDIACLFINKEKTNPIYMWEACGFHPETALEDLISKSLVKIVDGNKLWMHNHLRDLGREIVYQENSLYPGKCSRIWRHEDAQHILESKEGTRKIVALRVSKYGRLRDKRFGNEAFEPLPYLRFLEWPELIVSGNFENLLCNLRWLSWHYCPMNFEITNLSLMNLVILDLSRSYISEEWEGWSQTKMGERLKVIDLTSCKNLTRTPDFSRYHTLERLILEGCKKLIDINTVGMVKSLKHLNVRGCNRLQGLPESVASLDALEEIFVKGDGGSFSLPEEICGLKSLLVLEIVGVIVTKLPPSISKLERLKRLDLSHCSGMLELPRSFGKITALVKLDISYSSISKLPHSIRDLKALKVLNMKACEIVEIPATLMKLTGLEELNAKRTKLITVPRRIERLRSLRILDLSETNVSKLPQMSNLSSLEELHLRMCNNLLELPNLPSSLTILSITSSSLQSWPSLSNLKKLTRMSFGTGTHREVDFSNSNTNVPLDLRACSQLEALELNCRKMQHAPLLPSSLETLTLGYLDTGANFPRLSHLEHLSHLELSKCSLRNSCRNLMFRVLRSLVVFSIHNCELSELSGSWLPRSLESLEIKDCESLVVLRRMGEMVNLRRFRLSKCKNLSMVRGLGGLQTLRWLDISECHALVGRLESLSELENLQHVRVDDCRKFVDIKGVVESSKDRITAKKSSQQSNYISSSVPERPQLWNAGIEVMTTMRQYYYNDLQNRGHHQYNNLQEDNLQNTEHHQYNNLQEDDTEENDDYNTNCSTM